MTSVFPIQIPKYLYNSGSGSWNYEIYECFFFRQNIIYFDENKHVTTAHFNVSVC